MAQTNGVDNDVNVLIIALDTALSSGRAGDVATVRDRIQMSEPTCALAAEKCADAREMLNDLIDAAEQRFPAVRWGEAQAPAVSRESARTIEFSDENGGEVIFGTADATLDTPAPAAPRPATVVVRRPRPAAAVPAPAPAATTAARPAAVRILDDGPSSYNPNRISVGFGTALPFTGVKMYATDYESNVPYEFNYAGAGQDDVTKGSIGKIDVNYKRLLAELAPNSGWYVALGGKFSVLGSVGLPPTSGTIRGIEVTDSASEANIDEIRDESGAASWTVGVWTVGPTLTIAHEYFEAQLGLGFGNYTRTARESGADFDYGTSDDLTAGDFSRSTFAIHPEFALRGMLPLGDTFYFGGEVAVGAVFPLQDKQTRSEYVYEVDSVIPYFSPKAFIGVRF